MNILFTGLQSWDIAIGSNAKNIAQQMSTKHRILYVNPPADMSAMLKSNKQTPHGIRKVAENLFVADVSPMILPIGQLKPDLLFDRLNRMNNSNYADAILQAARSISFDNFIHIIDNDIYRSAHLKEYLSPVLSVYYRRDYMYTVDYWKRHASRVEPIIAAKADIVMANSPYLAEQMKPYNANTHYVGQGVDLTAYNPQTVVPKPMSYPRPIIGYAGAISSLRLDAQLIYSIAKSRPGYSFVMVGGEDEFFRNHPLHTLDNVYFTGLVTPDELPSYIASFDICINPQAVNDITVGNYPRKIDEYLSMGKPVVATRTPTMEIFKDYVALCDNSWQYTEAFDNFVHNRVDANRCIEFAKSHSWSNSVRKMLELIEKSKKKK